MKTKLFLITLSVIFNLCMHAQITFQATYGGLGWDECFSVKQTNDSGYVMAGYTSSFGAGSGDLYLVKTDKYGQFQWTKTYGGVSLEWGGSVEQTIDGGYIIGCSTESFGAGGQDFCLIKTDLQGNVQWMKTYGGTSWDKLYSIWQTSDGGFIMAGRTISFGGIGKLYLIRTDDNGLLLWSKTFLSNTGAYTVGHFVLEANDNGFFVVGATSTDPGRGTYWLKTDSIGNHQWSAYYNLAGSDISRGYSADQTSDDGFIITGESSCSGTVDVSLIKLNSSGNLLWSRCYGGSEDDYGYSVNQCQDGGFIIAGNTESFGAGGSDLYLLKTDLTGNLQWSNRYGGILDDFNPTYGSNSISAQQCNDGGFVIGGSTESFGAGQSDFYLIKTDTLGLSGCHESNTSTIVSYPFYWGNVNSTSDSVNTILNEISINALDVASSETFLCGIAGMNDNYGFNPAVKIYPNPFNYQTSITTESILVNAELIIYDLHGQVITNQKNISGQQIILNRDNLLSGIYFYKLLQGGYIIAYDKLIVTN